MGCISVFPIPPKSSFVSNFHCCVVVKALLHVSPLLSLYLDALLSGDIAGLKACVSQAPSSVGNPPVLFQCVFPYHLFHFVMEHCFHDLNARSWRGLTPLMTLGGILGTRSSILGSLHTSWEVASAESANEDPVPGPLEDGLTGREQTVLQSAVLIKMLQRTCAIPLSPGGWFLY